ncbi:MAG: prephenate dehydrogenase [Planctomycetaceae bacterium]
MLSAAHVATYNAVAMSQPQDAADCLFETVAIAGVGLIGGSIAAALKQRGLCRRVMGVGRNAERLAEARQRGLLDEASVNLVAAAARADLLVFCTPVDRIVPAVQEAAPACRPGTIITDAGSTKQEICRRLATALPAGIEFVGSHPLAGSEKQGFENADANLFAGRICVVTPVPTSSRAAVTRVANLWKALGATVVEMEPAAHDRAVGETSHLPHVLAAALALTLSPGNRNLAASGFRDTTRIAAGDPDVWAAILQENARPVLESLERCEEIVRSFRTALEAGDSDKIRELLVAAKAVRDALNRDK